MSELPKSPRPDLDPLDLDVKGIGVMGAALVAIVLIAAALMWWASVFLRGLEEANDPPPPALEEAREAYAPPGPLLQADPEAELVDLRAREELILETWAWVDKDAGVARVPIERAMELLVEGGPMATAPAAAAPEDGESGEGGS